MKNRLRCVQIRQRLSVLPGKKARQVGPLKVLVTLRLVLEGFEIKEAEGDPTCEPKARKMAEGMSPRAIGVPRPASTSSPCLKTMGIP
ncbi:hypothetical protein CO662_34490 [Rhizobium anhuiense]|uniref:Uncharacterized protein n=1 Tax=Rhizobium anhuiense TaxID=1184720 RepID=A0ABX4IXA0_9HYPH|nr:hypothetical protein CO662_34490 [Rhizobium anhuiense]